MASNVAGGVTIKGDEKLIKELKRLGVDVDRVLDDALKAGAKIIQREANPKAPGPHIEIGDVKKIGDGAEIKVGPDDEHWYYRFLEFGAGPHSIGGHQILTLFGEEFITGPVETHPGFAARPFLRPALDEGRGRAQDAMGDELKKAIMKGRSG